MMAAVGGNIIVQFTYTGAIGEVIPDEATHIIIPEDCTFVRAEAFRWHQNIIEVICHEGVEKIERYAFSECPNLRRVIMPGVKIIERGAFDNCTALEDVECGMLERIEAVAFRCCESLTSINLPSVRIVVHYAFNGCVELKDVKFGSSLERFEGGAFNDCYSLERITIPLKDGIIPWDNIFQGCEQLKHVELVEGAELHEIVAALQLEEWRNDMNDEIDSINQILLDTYAGICVHYNPGDEGGKARVMRTWIRTILGKIIHYQAEHQNVLDGAATTLQHNLPQDIVTNNILPFLELPSHIILEGGGEEDTGRA